MDEVTSLSVETSWTYPSRLVASDNDTFVHAIVNQGDSTRGTGTEGGITRAVQSDQPEPQPMPPQT